MAEAGGTNGMVQLSFATYAPNRDSAMDLIVHHRPRPRLADRMFEAFIGRR